MSLCKPSMDDLPVDVMANILSRVPVKTIIHCKCVCKKWLDLISESYFADLQHSRSPACFMIFQESKGVNIWSDCYKPGILKWVETEVELNHHHLQHGPVMSVDLHSAALLQNSPIRPMGSVNGLICLWESCPNTDNTYICNPITREYMILPRQKYYNKGYANVIYSFGIASVTQEYKVIRIFQENNLVPNSPSTSEAEVYTLGTGEWRSLGHVPYPLSESYGPFLNGNAHWSIYDHNSPEKIFVFNFDKETFHLFPSPPNDDINESEFYHHNLGVLKGCLCQIDESDSELRVWVMKEYGLRKSWHKELVIRESIGPKLMHIVGACEDGTILMASYGENLFVYCPRRKTIIDTEIYVGCKNTFVYRPSFHGLHNFVNERVHVFLSSEVL